MVNLAVVVGHVLSVVPGERADLLIVSDDSNPQYPTKVACEFYGKNKPLLEGIGRDELVRVSGSSRSREHEGRWYTNFSAFSIQKLQNGAARPAAGDAIPF
jgi:hypothetical protein